MGGDPPFASAGRRRNRAGVTRAARTTSFSAGRRAQATPRSPGSSPGSLRPRRPTHPPTRRSPRRGRRARASGSSVRRRPTSRRTSRRHTTPSCVPTDCCQAPEFLYNAAAALELGGDPDAAIATYDRYLTEAPSASDAERVRKHIETLKQKPAASGPDDEPPIAETGAEGASKWFDRAQAAYQAKNYGKAHTGFMHAYRLLGRPEFLYNAAAALQMGGDLDGAIALYDRYLAEAPGAGDAERVRKAVEKLRKKEIGGQVDDTAGGSATGAQGGEQPITATGDDGAHPVVRPRPDPVRGRQVRGRRPELREGVRAQPETGLRLQPGSGARETGPRGCGCRGLRALPRACSRGEGLRPGGQAHEETARAGRLRPDRGPVGRRGCGDRPDRDRQGRRTAVVRQGAGGLHGGRLPRGARRVHARLQGTAAAASSSTTRVRRSSMGGDATGAVALYERYLAEKPGASDAAKVQKRIAKLKAKAAGSAEPGAEGGEPPIEETGKEGARKWFARGEQQFRAANLRGGRPQLRDRLRARALPGVRLRPGDGPREAGPPGRRGRRLRALPGAQARRGEPRRRRRQGKEAARAGGRRPDRRPVGRRGRRPRPGRRGQGRRQAVVREGRGRPSRSATTRRRTLDSCAPSTLWPRAEYLFDAARALDEAGDAAGAIALYKRSLSEAGGVKDAARVQRLIDGLEQKANGGGEPTAP